MSNTSENKITNVGLSVDLEQFLIEPEDGSRWRVTFAELDDHSEVLDLDAGVIWIDIRHWREGAEFAVRHAVAHIDWGHLENPGPFTDEQCDLADWVAGVHAQPEVV